MGGFCSCTAPKRVSKGPRAALPRTMSDDRPVFVEILRAWNVKKSDIGSESDPYITVSLRDNMSEKAHAAPQSVRALWPTMEDCKDPSWFTTQFVAAEGHAGNGLRIRLYDEDVTSDDFLGEAIVPLGNFADEEVKKINIMSPGRGSKAQTVEVRIRRRWPSMSKRVHLIRHGESEWNDAQSNKKVGVMLSRVDHPLTPQGTQQALALSEQLRAHLNDKVKGVPADVVYVSPLLRAVQTAVLACAPLGEANRGLEWELKKNAREKRNLGGRDSSGTAFGADFLPYLKHEMRELLEAGAGEGVAMPDRATINGIVDALDRQEVDTQWWCDDREKADEAAHRARQLFFQQIMWDPRESIVVVGHSHFFRDFFATSFTDALWQKIGRGESAYTAEQWKERKLNNCGVARVDLNFAAALRAWAEGRAASDDEHKCIEDVELLFDTRLVS